MYSKEYISNWLKPKENLENIYNYYKIKLKII